MVPFTLQGDKCYVENVNASRNPEKGHKPVSLGLGSGHEVFLQETPGN